MIRIMCPLNVSARKMNEKELNKKKTVCGHQSYNWIFIYV